MPPTGPYILEENVGTIFSVDDLDANVEFIFERDESFLASN